MKIYRIKQDRKKVTAIVIALAVISVPMLMSGVFGIPFSGLIAFVGVVCIVTAIALFDMFLTGGVEVVLDDREDSFSSYPKLRIYTTKGNHNVTGKNMLIPFTKIVSVERRETSKKTPGVPSYNMCANFMPKNVMLIRFEEGYGISELFADVDDEVYSEIVTRAERFSGLREEDA